MMISFFSIAEHLQRQACEEVRRFTEKEEKYVSRHVADLSSKFDLQRQAAQHSIETQTGCKSILVISCIKGLQ